MSIIYKPGQGKYARIAAGGFLAFFVGYGCISLQGVLGQFEEVSPVAARAIPVGIFLVSLAVIALVMNYPRFADLLIETEIEIGRVVWPTRNEVMASAMVVIVAVILMAALLYGADWLLLMILRIIGLY